LVRRFKRWNVSGSINAVKTHFGASDTEVQLNIRHGWIDVREILTRLSLRLTEDNRANWSSNLVALLGAPAGLRAQLSGAARELLPNTSRDEGAVIIPFEPRSYRDFMLYERHAVDAARCQVLHAKVRTYRPDLRGPHW
jgi:hypothetical protein